MLYFLLFARTDTIKKEWENLLSSFIPEPFHIETALFPDGPVSLLPENLPSCFLIDRSGMPKLPENTWLQLLSIQYPLIPILYYEEASAFREQLESLLLKETGGSLPTGNPCLSYAKSRSFLDNLTSLGSASPQEDPEFPDYSHVSFAVCAARLSDSSCDDPAYEASLILSGIIFIVLPLPLLAKEILTMALCAPLSTVSAVFSQKIGYSGDMPATANSLSIIISIVCMITLLLIFI